MENWQLKFQFSKFLLVILLFIYACSTSKQGSDTTKEIPTIAQPKQEESKEEAPASEMEDRRQELANKTTIDGIEKDKVGPDNSEEYDKPQENPFLAVKQVPLSTFSIDVDNAAYSNIRRFLTMSQLPPPGAVRIEEMINYFDYEYPQPTGEHPFALYTELEVCPWNPKHQLIHIGLQGKSLNYNDLRPSNLVFLVDASGSMSDINKLPLLKKSLGLLLDNLSNQDRVAIVAYAGAAGLVLPSTPANQKQKILSALDALEAGGSTAGGEGINLAYKIAQENLKRNGNNRVILCTDGDFNVGVSSDEDLVKLIEEKRQSNIYLTICGFGMGNYKDRKMEMISNAGNGNYFYIDNIQEARKVFQREMRANLFTIAKDVKIQIEFNPTQVKGYRLIGYENRMLKNEDFDNDKKDAGELGAGHSVTALYEIIPANSDEVVSQNPDLKYQQTTTKSSAEADEIMTIKFRYKPPQSETSKLIVQTLKSGKSFFATQSQNFKFSAAVAGFGLLLKQSQYKGTLTYSQVLQLANASLGKDEEGDRTEFVKLVKTAQLLSK
ncbi:MAG: VWA domain-containing protein [Microscillaceae bacterium]|jgi:Ca-activated chloride channel family protein|nr:VWA domain-containing protein [Microscillaceae bacterium]